MLYPPELRGRSNEVGDLAYSARLVHFGSYHKLRQLFAGTSGTARDGEINEHPRSQALIVLRAAGFLLILASGNFLDDRW